MGIASEEGVRERKRRETRQRIAESALRLFLVDGYEGTTLDAIALEAGISRRTFFSYFKSKDDIVISWLEAGWASVNADLLKTSPDVHPFEAVRDVFIAHSARYPAEEMEPIDRLMRSSESLQARKQTLYVEQERALFLTLCEVWRQPERRMALRALAMVAIGAMRLATQAWGEQTGQKKPIAELVRETFNSLRTAL